MPAAGNVTEQVECQVATAGGAAAGGGAKPKPVFDLALCAQVAVPLLQLSQQAVTFSYIHTRGSKPQVMVQPLEVR